VFTPVKLFFELVAEDAKAYGRERLTISFFIAALLGLSPFSAVLLYRVGSALFDKGLLGSALAKLAYKCNYWWNSCEIRPQARIGPGLHIPHPIGVHIGPIRAGRNLIVHQNASIALKDRSLHHQDSGNFACFGDNVTVGPCASVLGRIVIGDGVAIGANAIVHKDLPAGCLAVANPARVLPARTMATGRTSMSEQSIPIS
jgi:serine O-acetyltransferase